MVASNADEATDNAKSYSNCEPGYCLKYVRTWLEIGSQQPSAIEAWENANHKHEGRNPPRGAPCFYKGGNYGHIVLALNNRESDGVQMVRTTDAPSSGKVTTQTISWCENNWGYRYLGWTEDLNGIWIPWLKEEQPDWRASGKVYVEKLHKGQQDSDSVSRLRYRLENHKDIPNDKKPGYGADYGDKVVTAVKWWQRNHGWPDGEGESMGNKQANKLFGDNYTVIEE